MECFWRLFGYRQPDGDRYQQDPPVFYICLHPDDGLSDYPLHGTGFLAEYPEVYVGGEAESVVLFVNGEQQTGTPPGVYSLLTIDYEPEVR
jgi:hypothetical protein